LPFMHTVPLIIKGISYSQAQNGAYALILAEEAGDRKLPIVIGAFEAQAIAVALEEDLKPPRPLTHDLFKNTLSRFEITLEYVLIHKLKEGVFYASLICSRDQTEEIIDARTSDAVALAARFGAPIHTYDEILDQAGITFSSIDMTVTQKPQEDIETVTSAQVSTYQSYSEKQLRAALKKAVTDEDYEKAAAIRDELERRNLS
jgi:bifunctional DNase/RNase